MSEKEIQIALLEDALKAIKNGGNLISIDFVTKRKTRATYKNGKGKLK